MSKATAKKIAGATIMTIGSITAVFGGFIGGLAMTFRGASETTDAILGIFVIFGFGTLAVGVLIILAGGAMTNKPKDTKTVIEGSNNQAEPPDAP